MDPELLRRLLDQHSAALELYARQWCDMPEDAVQEAFLKLARQRALPSNLAAWLFRVVRNAAISAGRAARRRRRHEAGAAGAASTWFEPAAAADQAGLLDPELATTALCGLPLEQREVIVAHLWGGLTFEQVAELAGCSSSTAHRLYAAGLSTLRERLGVSCRKSRPIPN
jgi:RNA polymerase sigma-70 factor (ECF subfamily)